MATKLLTVHGHLIQHHRQNFKFISYFLRYFSSQNGKSSETSNNCQNHSNVNNTDSEPISKWLNIKAAIFGPRDNRLPLPGEIGLGQDFKKFSKHKRKIKKDQNTTTTNINKSRSSINISVAYVADMQTKQEVKMKEAFESLSYQMLIENNAIFSGEKEYVVEFISRVCPTLLKKDFAMFFPDQNFANREMTVLTVCQKTVNDMSSWSEDIEEERERLMKQFIKCAHQVCNSLRDEGYWADFIDPCSGRPFLGPFTSSTLFETDERYRHFGFTIEDLGCCKVITHHAWGRKIFVGTIFTDAPSGSEVLKCSLEDLQNEINKYAKT